MKIFGGSDPLHSGWKCAKVLSSIILKLFVYICNSCDVVIVIMAVDHIANIWLLCHHSVYSHFQAVIGKLFNSGGAIKHFIRTMGHNTYNIVSFSIQCKELNFSWCFSGATKGVGYPTEHSRGIVILHLISWDSKVWANEL